MTRNQRIWHRTVRPECGYFKKEPLLEPSKLNKILLQPFVSEGRYSLRAVIIRRFVGDALPTGNTSVDDHPSFSSTMFDADRFHQPSAERCTVAGTLVIHVLAPQTPRAVVAAGAVLQRLHFGTAVLARERFLARNEGRGRQGRRGVRGIRRGEMSEYG